MFGTTNFTGRIGGAGGGAGGGGTGGRGGGGGGRREQTREELLASARREREGRAEARRRAAAATRVQAAWRGHAARARRRDALLAEWRAAYGAASADPSADPAPVVAALLSALLPPGQAATRRALERGLALRPPSADWGSALRGTLALVIRSFSSPPPPPAQAAEAGRGWEPPPYVRRAWHQQQPGQGAGGGGGEDEAATAEWQRQAARLCQLCCAAVQCTPLPPPGGSSAVAGAGAGGGGGGGGSALLDAAALRVVSLLTDSSQWRWPAAGGGDSTDAERARLLTAGVLGRLASAPLPLLCASRRLLVASSSSSPPSSAPAPTQPPVSPTGGGGPVSSALTVQRALLTCTAALEADELRAAVASPSPAPSPSPRVCRAAFVRELLACPALRPHLAPASPLAPRLEAALPSSPPSSLALLLLDEAERAARQDGGEVQASPSVSSSTSFPSPLRGARALWVLAALARVLATTAPAGSSNGPAPPNLALSNPAVAARFCRAAVALLSAADLPDASDSGGGGGGGNDEGSSSSKSAAAAEAARTLAAPSHLVLVMEALGGPPPHPSSAAAAASAPPSVSPSDGPDARMGIFLGYALRLACHLPEGGGAGAGAGGAGAGRSDARRRAAAALARAQAVGDATSSDEDEEMDDGATAEGQGAFGAWGARVGARARRHASHHQQQATTTAAATITTSAASLNTAVLGTLAFAPAVLPRLWRWLAAALGVPLEAPRGASLGLDVAACRGGVAALPAAGALALGVFAAAYGRLLLVLDDDDIHSRGKPFTAAGTRAIAATLNSLVFHSHFPLSSGRDAGGGHARAAALAAAAGALDPRTLALGQDLLRRAAPVALRRLSNRDARRAFCQPALWLAPYEALSAAQEHDEHRSAAAAATAFGGGGGGSGGAGLFGGGGGGGPSTAAAAAARSFGAPLHLFDRREREGSLGGGGGAGQRGGDAMQEDGDEGEDEFDADGGGGWTHGGGGGGGGGAQQAAAAARPPSSPPGRLSRLLPSAQAAVAAIAQRADALAGRLAGGSGGGAAGAAAAAAAASTSAAAPAAAIDRHPAMMAALLRAAPQCLPFDHRLDLFRRLVALDRERLRFVGAGGASARADGSLPPLGLSVRRSAVLDDAFAALSGRPSSDLKRRLDVTFVDAYGRAEPGIDHGGLTREMLDLALSSAVKGNYGLFSATQPDGLVYPNPAAELVGPEGLALCEFVGALLGRALYEGVGVAVELAPFFATFLQAGDDPRAAAAARRRRAQRAAAQRQQRGGGSGPGGGGGLASNAATTTTNTNTNTNTNAYDDDDKEEEEEVGAMATGGCSAEDLSTLDPALWRAIQAVRNYPGDVSDLGLTFSAEREVLGRRVTTSLLPGRGDEPVTDATRLLYVSLLADYHLRAALGPPARAFRRGFSAVIANEWIRVFTPAELNLVIGGGAIAGGLDGAAWGGGGGKGGKRSAADAVFAVDDLRAHTRYSGGYTPHSGAVRAFWRVVEEMGPGERAALLRFVTASSRPPLGGFSALDPPFTIHRVDARAEGMRPRGVGGGHGGHGGGGEGRGAIPDYIEPGSLRLHSDGGAARRRAAEAEAALRPADEDDEDASMSEEEEDEGGDDAPLRQHHQEQQQEERGGLGAPLLGGARRGGSGAEAAGGSRGGGVGSMLSSLIGRLPDVERLPTASTCFSMLKLPPYRRRGTLKEKLLLAISGAGGGFELS